MRKMLAGLIAALFLAAGLSGGVAVAEKPEDAGPGPNGSNNKGLCTAYFNGQKNGHEEGSGPGPFGVMENEDAQEYDQTHGGNDEEGDELQISDDVFEYCQQYGIMGNPEENGRFDCRTDEERDGPARDTDGDGELECIDNP